MRSSFFSFALSHTTDIAGDAGEKQAHRGAFGLGFETNSFACLSRDHDHCHLVAAV
jgi:hypothetical protein